MTTRGNMTGGPTDGRTTVLLTGFGPFPAQPVNATMALVPAIALHSAGLFPDVRIITDILPTQWAAAPARLTHLLAAHQPDIALHFGVSSRARGFEIEARARNVCGDTEDAAGARAGGNAISVNGPDLMTSNLPVAEIVTRLRRRGIEAYLSWDAGTYLCNAVLYQSLTQAKTQPGLRRNGFIHIPALLAVPGQRPTAAQAACRLTFDQAVDGGAEILATCLARPVSHVQPRIRRSLTARPVVSPSSAR